MADISIIEFVVYGFITYTSMLMLIISTIKEVPEGKSRSIIRSIYMIPGILCAFILANSGVNITAQDITNTIINLNTTEVYTETISTSIELINPVWVIVHFLFGAVLSVYVIIQLLSLMTKHE